MSRLRDRNRQVPNGLKYVQPETGFKPIPWSSFDSIVTQVLQHRNGNQWLAKKYNWNMTRESVAGEIDSYNATEMELRGYTDFIWQGGPPVVFPGGPFPQKVPNVENAAGVSRVSKVASGISTLVSWLGKGLSPVNKDLAEKRASVCVKCPLNKLGNFWEQLEAVAAAELRTLISIRADMELKTSQDASLYSCSACSCWNALKVHVPIDHILKHTSEEVKQKLDPYCWVLAESKLSP